MLDFQCCFRQLPQRFLLLMCAICRRMSTLKALRHQRLNKLPVSISLSCASVQIWLSYLSPQTIRESLTPRWRIAFGNRLGYWDFNFGNSQAFSWGAKSRPLSQLKAWIFSTFHHQKTGEISQLILGHALLIFWFFFQIYLRKNNVLQFCIDLWLGAIL